MWALGFGGFFVGYGLIFYGIALATGQHMNLMYCLFHTGPQSAQLASGTPSATPYTGSTPANGSRAGQGLLRMPS